jgi:UDP-N-acetylmuramoylalanine-D-glutamate ligase
MMFLFQKTKYETEFNVIINNKYNSHKVTINLLQIKRIAVIGAGSSGIAAAKECLQAGFEVVVYEQTHDVSLFLKQKNQVHNIQQKVINVQNTDWWKLGV